MKELLLIAFCVVAIAIIILVLLQNGKGAGMGSAFGAGASATIFGSSGSASFLVKLTTILGIIFFVICLVLANLSTGSFGGRDSGRFSDLEAPATEQKTNQINSDVPGDHNMPSTITNEGVASDIPQ